MEANAQAFAIERRLARERQGLTVSWTARQKCIANNRPTENSLLQRSIGLSRLLNAMTNWQFILLAALVLVGGCDQQDSRLVALQKAEQSSLDVRRLGMHAAETEGGTLGEFLDKVGLSQGHCGPSMEPPGIISCVNILAETDH